MRSVFEETVKLVVGKAIAAESRALSTTIGGGEVYASAERLYDTRYTLANIYIKS
jgi:hypothetical protein